MNEAANSSRPLRLLRLVHTLHGESGGPAESVRRSTEALIALGHSVEIVTLQRPRDLATDEPLAVRALGEAKGPGARGYGATPLLIPWLRAHRTHFDAVLVHGLWQFQGWAAYRALRNTNTPYLVFPHGMLDPWFRHTYPLKHYKKQLYWWLREGRVLAGAAATCFTCDEERRLARGEFTPYRVRERVVAYGTADPVAREEEQRAAFLARAPEAAGREFLLFLGRLHPKKGLENLLRALARRPDAPLLVVAGPGLDGGHGSAMRELAERLLPPGAVLWPGMLAGDAKWGALRACEALVLPSHQENFGIAVAEALACGRPVLISDKVNIWREIAADGAGLVRGDTQDEVAALLAAWAETNAERRAAMGRAARGCFLSRFEIRRAAESLVETIHGVRSPDA